MCLMMLCAERISVVRAVPEELSGMCHEKAVRCHLLRTELLMQHLAVYPARTAKVGDPRLRGHARPTEEDRTTAALQDFFESCDLVHGRSPFVLTGLRGTLCEIAIFRDPR